MQNKTLFDKLNIDNPNETAQRIGKGNLSAICRAVGVLTPGDSSELHMKPLRITVKTRKREDTGEMVNEVKAYKPRNGAGSFAPSQPMEANDAAKAPWMAR